MDRLVPLSCAVQKYAWGKPAADSLVAQLTGVTDSKENYAELWMGTHPKGPSTLKSGELLVDWIKKDAQRLGDVAKGFRMDNGGLPFLLKVLSVGKALSIQAHPTKEHAKELHKAFPQHYPDANHKPEMAIALTQFEGMCGFRPLHEIQAHMKHLFSLGTDLREILPDLDPSEDYIKQIFCSLIASPRLAEIVAQIYGALQGKEYSHIAADKLFLQIYKQHPGDKGLICIYLLNHVILQPGECMFLGPNKIHAYFSGDCIECMACSDNTVRSGLTPKFVDVDTLCEMLDYSPGTAASQKLPSSSADHVTSYLPPINDFAVDKFKVDPSMTLKGKASPGIVLCVEGKGTIEVGNYVENVGPGSVFYICPNTDAVAKGNMLLFEAYCH